MRVWAEQLPGKSVHWNEHHVMGLMKRGYRDGGMLRVTAWFPPAQAGSQRSEP